MSAIGVSRTLYLAFGVLEWYESPSSQEATHLTAHLRAGIPDRVKRATGSFTLKFLEDIECEINPTFARNLKYGFKIVLPTFSELVSGRRLMSR